MFMITNCLLLWCFLLITSSVINHPLRQILKRVMTHVIWTCVNKFNCMIKSFIKMLSDKLSGSFLPIPNVCHPSPLICKFYCLHLVLEIPFHPRSNQIHKILPNFPPYFFSCLVYTYWLWYPLSQTLQTIVTIFGQHTPSIVFSKLVQHSQVGSCEYLQLVASFESSIQP